MAHVHDVQSEVRLESERFLQNSELSDCHLFHARARLSQSDVTALATPSRESSHPRFAAHCTPTSPLAMDRLVRLWAGERMYVERCAAEDMYRR